MLEIHPLDVPVKCKVLRDFEIRGLHYHIDQIVKFRAQTAKLLALTGKISYMEQPPDVLRHR